jgi:hypothetical protein
VLHKKHADELQQADVRKAISKARRVNMQLLTMAVLWLYYGYTMAILWLYLLWLHCGCTVAALWLNYGLTMA